MTTKYLPDDRWQSAPPIPLDRPPTRAEVWAYVEHLYHDLKTEDERKAFAAQMWAGNYAWWVNWNGWNKQPDWTEGDPVIPAAVPKRGSILSGSNVYQIVKSHLDQARSAA